MFIADALRGVRLVLLEMVESFLDGLSESLRLFFSSLIGRAQAVADLDAKHLEPRHHVRKA